MNGRLLAGRFRVTGPALDEGASGVVYPGVDEQTDRRVAIKLLHDHLADDPATLARLDAEAGMAGRLQHPHIVPVLGLWSDDGRWFLVTEQVDGRGLDRIDGPLAPEAVIALGLHVCDALTAAHEHGLVHGDLRPGNVLVGPSGARLLDFGAGQYALAARGAQQLRPGQTAPEVHRGAPAGVPADIYGLGVVLYQALTGHLPWSGPTPFAVIGAQDTPPPRPPGPAGLGYLVARMLHPDPARRPPDVAAVAAALRRLQRNPHRRVAVGGRWVAPIRPGHAWMVHGVDPATGARSLIRGELSRRGAHDLAARLQDEGWDVTVAKASLGWADLAWVLAMAAVAGVGIPVVGLVLGAALGLWWRSSTCEARLREVLPPVVAPVPPREAPAGAEYAVAAGLLLLLTAWLLWAQPLLAPLPVVLLVLVIRASRSAPIGSAGDLALRARIATVLADARAAIEGRAHGLDRALALQGELDVLERQWREGEVAEAEVLGRAEALQCRAGAADRRADLQTSQALEALRRT